MSRLVDTVLPPRLGSGFRWLVASSWTTNVGDGIALAAGPLLVASQTRDARLVAASLLAVMLPWLLFGLFAGALADRVDRRVLLAVANLLRTAVLVVLATVIWTGHVDVTVVLATMFVLGTAEVFADTTTGTLLPMLVAKPDLGVANARIQAGFLTANQLAGPPLGAFLFAAGMAWPFVTQAVCVALGVMLVWRIGTPRGPVRVETDSHVLRDIADGLRWLGSHPPVRTLALVIVTFNLTWAAPWSVLVLWSLDRLDMGPVGFGLLTTASALGGMVGTASFGWLERRFPLAFLMRTCLLLEVLMHLALALTTVPWVALVVLFGFGCYAFVWGTLSQAVRQRAVPTEFQGRVASVYMMSVTGGILGGSALGGVIAERWGLAAPWWFAFVGSGLTLVLVWRQIGHIAHADEEAATPGRHDRPVHDREGGAR